MKIITADFITGAVSPKQFPPEKSPEFAFAGKSNVGKSSLINSLLNRKKLVRTSQTPGKTQMINFFAVNSDLVFADLPGYGYAKVPESIRKNWRKLIESYLLKRKKLKGVIFLIDIRRGISDLDKDLQEWLESGGIDYVLVATKSDKLTRSEKKRQLKELKEFSSKGGEIIPYSSKSAEGRQEVWKWIQARAEGK